MAVVAIAVVGLALGGGSGADDKGRVPGRVVNTRDRIDFSLGRLSKAQTLEELLTRMDEAAETIDDAAGDLDDVSPPEGLEDQHDRLVEQVGSLAGDIQGTADQARTPGFEDILTGAAGLDFPSWDCDQRDLRRAPWARCRGTTACPEDSVVMRKNGLRPGLAALTEAAGARPRE